MHNIYDRKAMIHKMYIMDCIAFDGDGKGYTNNYLTIAILLSNVS